jgi:hypothetical protein
MGYIPRMLYYPKHFMVFTWLVLGQRCRTLIGVAPRVLAEGQKATQGCGKY